MSTCDVMVVGAGVFGAWTALHLRRSGHSVLLLDAYGAGNSRSSSGDESRIIRMGYGADEIYTRWAMRSLGLWRELFEQIGRPELFQRTGVLWTPLANDARAEVTQAVFERCGVQFSRLRPHDVEGYSQLRFREERVGLLEPLSGYLLAQQAVQAVVAQAVREGVEYREAGAPALDRSQFTVYACGPWLPKLFPELLVGRVRVTRQEVFFFDTSRITPLRLFAPPHMPIWIDITGDHGAYVIPAPFPRFKLAFDKHGPEFDPDTGDRVAGGADNARAFLAERFPKLANVPLLESRVCQYSNTSNGDFLIDRHPDFENVWLVGGGSGHGFKHGPVVGEHVCALIDGKATVEPRFSLASKGREARRSVF